MRLEIYSQSAFDAAVKADKFKSATDVCLENLPGVTAIPEMPAATNVCLDNLPRLQPQRPPNVVPRGTLYRNGRVLRRGGGRLAMKMLFLPPRNASVCGYDPAARAPALIPAMAAHLACEPVSLAALEDCQTLLLKAYLPRDVEAFLFDAIEDAKAIRGRAA